MNRPRLIERDAFPFEFLSKLGERESWRKEVHRPIYHVHKWWAKRLGTVFRGVLLGCLLPDDVDLAEQFYRRHAFSDKTVFDPFMGSGTTVGEAHKLGLTALGRDINPVAVESVRVALGPLDRARSSGTSRSCLTAWEKRSAHSIFPRIRGVESATCCIISGSCKRHVPNAEKPWTYSRPTFSPRTLARIKIRRFKFFAHRAVRCLAGYMAKRTSAVRRVISSSTRRAGRRGRMAFCGQCRAEFAIIDAVQGKRPPFRLYAKLVLRRDGEKEYLPPLPGDFEAYDRCSGLLREKAADGGSGDSGSRSTAWLQHQTGNEIWVPSLAGFF